MPMPVDLTGPIRSEFEKARKRAEDLVEQGRIKEAAGSFRHCAELMRRLAQYSVNSGLRAQQMERAAAYDDLATRAAAGKIARSAAVADADGADSLDSDLASEIEALITKSPVTWDDIGGLADTKRTIRQAYAIALARKPAGVNVRPLRNMLFYGPPGTGKTMLAAATSNGLDATFFNVKGSDLLSKYFGDSSKRVAALFEVARAHAPAVIYIDEISELLPPRDSDGVSGAERRVVSQMLMELDGLSAKGDTRFVMTIAGSNYPWQIDKAMLSRFEKKVYIPLPDAEARAQILRIQVERNGYRTGVGMDDLVKRTEGFSGREIERLCKEASGRMIDRANAGLVEKTSIGREALVAHELKVEALSAADFDYAFAQFAPETTSGDLRRLEQWARNLR